MAQDGESKSVDKGKSKALDADLTKSKDTQNGVEKQPVNGKNEEPVLGAEELSEEDAQLKAELDMLVERLSESDTTLYKTTLETIKELIKTSTSSMTAVPKPLKFLRPHYEPLIALYENWPAGNDKTSLADVLSVIGMTYSDKERQDTLKFRLLAPSADIASWGHEYTRHLALELGEVHAQRLNSGDSTKDLVDLALVLVPLFLNSNAEADAVDLLSELVIIEEIDKFLDKDNYARVCLYMVSMVNLLTYPEDQEFLKTAHRIYTTYKQHAQALIISLRLNDMARVRKDFELVEDPTMKKQMALLVGREQMWLENFESGMEDETAIADCLNNVRLPDYFKALGKELNILDPKSTEDIYKSHLESDRTAAFNHSTTSASHNLAAGFVNAFVNAGFGNDKMMLVDEDANSWVWKTKAEGQMSTVASLGMLMLWDVESGLNKVDKYTYYEDPNIQAGALLAIGIMNTNVRLDSDPALALLGDTEKINHKDAMIRVAAIMGLGLSYAGSLNADVLDILLPLVGDSSLDMQTSAMAALALGMIFVGSSSSDVGEAIVQTLLDDDRQHQLKDKWIRFMALGLGLLYFGKEEEVDVILEILGTIDHPMSKPTALLAEICANAGSGGVLMLQKLLHVCNEHFEDSDDKKGDELLQSYAVIGLSLVAMGEEVGQEMVLRQFGHLMHYGEANIRKAVPLAMGLISPSNPQMKVYDTLSRYSHDNDIDVATNAIFSMGLLGAGTNNARIALLLRQLASYYHRDAETLFMVRIAQGLLHMGKGTLSINPFHTDRQVLSKVATAGLLAVLIAMVDAKQFITKSHHYLLYFLVTAMHPRFLVTLDEDLKPVTVNVRVGQAVDVVGQAGRPKTITGWQTQSTPVLLAYGERAELEDEQYISLSPTLEGLVILKKNPEWEVEKS